MRLVSFSPKLTLLVGGLFAGLTVASTGHAHVVLDTPSRGELLTAGSTYRLTWTDTVLHEGIGYDIDLIVGTSPAAAGGEVIPIAHGLPTSQHEYAWRVPSSACTGCTLKIVQVNVGISYEFEELIDIAPPPPIDADGPPEAGTGGAPPEGGKPSVPSGGASGSASSSGGSAGEVGHAGGSAGERAAPASNDVPSESEGENEGGAAGLRESATAGDSALATSDPSITPSAGCSLHRGPARERSGAWLGLGLLALGCARRRRQ